MVFYKQQKDVEQMKTSQFDQFHTWLWSEHTLAVQVQHELSEVLIMQDEKNKCMIYC